MFLNKMRGGGNKKKSKPSVFDTLQKQLKDLEQSFEETPTPTVTTRTGTPTKPIPIPGLSLERKPIYPTAESAEILEAPYSNLEEGIIDEVHQSKFKHHGAKFKHHQTSEFEHHQTSEFEHFDSAAFTHRDITDDEVGKERKKNGKDYLKDFDAKRAFVHSIIFERKHF